MGFILIAENDGWRLWIAPLIFAIPASIALSILSLPGPRSGEIAGVVMVSTGGAAGFLALVQIDPTLQLVDQRWQGHLIFVVSQQHNFAQLARSAGAEIVFDAKAVGCNFSSATGLARTPTQRPRQAQIGA